MADFKNQHYVPRCYLENFAWDERRKRVCLLNIDRGKFVRDASIKTQCSRAYFYGDAAEERKFEYFEGAYAEAVRDVMSGSISATTGEKLRAFSVLQYARTEGAARQAAAQSARFRDAIDPEGHEFGKDESWDEKTALKESLANAAQMHKFFDDLDWAIIVNETKSTFVTSDDPAILTNRYARQRLGLRKFGAISSGLTLSLPLTPRHWIVFYDSQVYRMSDRIGRTVRVRDAADVLHLNQLTCIKAARNIYYADVDAEPVLTSVLKSVSDQRGDDRFQLVLYREDEPGSERYTKVDAPDIYDGASYLTSMAPNYPVPPRWFSKLKIRMNPVFFTAGTMTRHVRRPEWLHDATRELWRTQQSRY
jgi:hypothetical protein